MARTPSAEGGRAGVPIIDKMIDMLDLLERRPDGATIRDISQSLAMPRSSVYRVLTTLQKRSFLRRSPTGSYSLGTRFVTLAAHVAESPDYDLVEIATPHLTRLSDRTGEACKVSIRDQDGVLVVARSAGAHEYGLTLRPGRVLPLHVGAAGKLILAHMPVTEIETILGAALAAFTPKTMTDPKKIRTELRKIRQQGWAEDRGEHSALIRAFAAPIFGPDGKVVAALSIPFLDNKTPAAMKTIRDAALDTAATISADLGSTMTRRHATGS